MRLNLNVTQWNRREEKQSKEEAKNGHKRREQNERKEKKYIRRKLKTGVVK